NAPLSGAEMHIQVLDAAGTVRGDWVRPLGDLLPGSQGTVAVDWSSAGAAVGSYRAHLDVRMTRMAGTAGAVLTSAETLFDLTSQSVQVTGGITLADRSVAWGAPLVLGTLVSNAGTGALSQVPVRLLVLDAAASRP